MRKLLVICGPTATGKTSLALHLANLIGGELVSVDSRQIYKGLDVGTGKDIPRNFVYNTAGYYENGQTRIWGYDLVGADQEFSVSQYGRKADMILKNIYERNKLPILVGGTGLYIRAVVDGIGTIHIPIDYDLRKSLADMSPHKLYKMLMTYDKARAIGMNLSDRANKRRLVRAIEIALTKDDGNGHKSQKRTKKDVLFIGLTAPKETLDKKISLRVDARLTQGIESEITNLLTTGVTWKMQSMSSLGYRQWRDFFSGKKEKAEVISDWLRAEKKYAKRQLTWFKKDKRIKWFDISKKNWLRNVEKVVLKWHNNTTG